jgi:HPt (histidine-containing phosphotransfer) domain-containing protein
MSAQENATGSEQNSNLDIEAYAASMGIRDVKLVIGLYDAFFSGLAEQLCQIKAYAADKNFPELRAVAHSIKGSAANLQLTAIATIAGQIQKLAETGGEPEAQAAELAKVCAKTEESYKSKYK